MKIGMFVNDLEGEQVDYTSTLLAHRGTLAGHEIWYIEVAGFAYDPDDMVRARAVRVAGEGYDDQEAYLEALRGDDAVEERIDIADLDVLMLRNDPSVSASEHPWTQDVGIIFGQVAARRGVVVVNDPDGLARAKNKLYFQFFPQEVRPRTLITRETDQIKEFVEEMGGRAVLKPLQGSGGKNVFLVRENTSNLNQMIDAVARDGYVIAQEYLAAAAEGDTRFFLVNGRPLEVDGHYAALRRLTPPDDARSNMHVGAKTAKAKIGETELHLAELVRPKLIQDGMYFVGLDIAGDKLMEINVNSPGGLCTAQNLEGVDFVAPILDNLLRKVGHAGRYSERLSNRELAVL